MPSWEISPAIGGVGGGAKTLDSDSQNTSQPNTHKKASNTEGPKTKVRSRSKVVQNTETAWGSYYEC